MFAQGQFLNDANATPESIARKRAMIAALMPRFGSAKYVGEGLGQLATGVMIGRQNKKLDGAEAAGRKSAEELFGSLLGTGGSAEPGGFTVMGQPGMAYAPSQPAPPRDPNSPDAVAADTMFALGKINPTDREILAKTLMAEAGGEGYGGMLAAGSVIDNRRKGGNYGEGWEGVIMKPGQFSAWNGVTGYAGGEGGLNMDGMTPSEDAYAAADAILTGNYEDPTGGATHYYNPNVANPKWGQQAGGDWQSIGNHVFGFADAGREGAPQPGSSAPAGPQGGVPQIPMQDLMAAMADPWLAPEQKAVLQSIYEQQVQAGDPMRQLELQKAQLELAQLQNPTDAPPEDFTARMFTLNALGMDPQSPEGQHYMLTGQLPDTAGGNRPAAFQSLDLQAQAAGFAPGTPEYQEFMRNGGGSGTPAAFTALDLQARAAGFEPGTPEYQEFMGTRGAGLAEGAKVRAGAAAEAEVAAPADIVVADRTLGYIDEVRNHPGKGQGTGFSSYGNWIPGTSGKDFQNRVDQLKSGAFLSAIDEMRGMGSLSNAEGQTATAAITRMDTATSEEEFNAALDDYERIVKLGRDRAEKRIKAPGGEPPATDTDGWTTLPNGVKIRVKQ